MKKNIQLVKGTHDIYGEDIKKFNFIVDKNFILSPKNLIFIKFRLQLLNTKIYLLAL